MIPFFKAEKVTSDRMKHLTESKSDNKKINKKIKLILTTSKLDGSNEKQENQFTYRTCHHEYQYHIT